MSLRDDLMSIFDPVENQRLLEAAGCYWQEGYRDGRGGGEATATAQSREVLVCGVQRRLDRIDRYQSPGIASGPSQLADGRWTATIRWFGLD